MRALLLLAALLALAPLASAGKVSDPEAADPSGDTTAPNTDFADILAVWAEAANGTLTLTMQVKSYTQGVPQACWVMGFRIGSTESIATVRAGGAEASGVTHSGMVTTADDPAGGNASAPVIKMGSPATISLAVAKVVPGELVELTDLRTCYVATGGTDVGGIPGGDEVPLPPEGGVPTDPSRIDSATATRGYSVPFPAPPPVAEKPKPKANETVTGSPPAKSPVETTPKSNTTLNETLSPASNTESGGEVSAAAPEERGFFGLPGPAPLLLAGALAALGLLARRR